MNYTDEATYAATRLPVEQATTLIPDAYRSDAFYAVEQDRVWARSWVCVGYTSQLEKAGSVMTAEVAGQSILIVRNKQNELRAFHNVCRHRGSRLVESDTACNVIRCPYHSWGYSLDGELLGAPYFKGLDVPAETQAHFDTSTAEKAGFKKSDFGLLPVKVGAWGCFVFVNLDPDARPVEDLLGDLPQRYARHPLGEMVLHARRSYEIKANWKLIAENFTEYYHLPWVHPELCNISGFDDHYRYQGPGMYTGMCTSPLSVDPNTVSFDLPVHPGLNYTESRSAYFVLLFPNVALWLFPNHLVTLLYRPSGVTSTVEHMDMLLHPAALATEGVESRSQTILDFYDMVNKQDIDIVERVQRGLGAKAYPGGRMCYRFEEPIHRLQNMVIDRMVGIERVPAGDEKEEAPVLKPGR